MSDFGTVSAALAQFPTTQYIVKATDDRRPGWSFVWGGTIQRSDADKMATDFQREHPYLRFVVVART